MHFSGVNYFVLCSILVLCIQKELKAEFENQPKIQAKDGTLTIETARDQEIVIRLGRTSAVFVNDFNLMDAVQKHYASAGKDMDVKSSLASLAERAAAMRRDLQRFDQWFIRTNNGTRNRMQSRLIIRDLSRITLISLRISEIEDNLNLDECKENPCKNGGACYDGYKSFRCECLSGWTGQKCERDVDECYAFAGTALGCQNNADCVNMPGSYRCTCHAGFSGTHCRLKTAVCTSESRELCDHGVCVHANNDRGYTCVCDQGWTTNNVTSECSVDVDECASPTNPCHSNCINLPGSYKCGPCPGGYTGDGITCKDIDECATNNGGCSIQPKVACINTDGSYHCGQHCPPGWTGDGRTCLQVPSNSCNKDGICHPRAKCEYISGTAVCTCPLGMYGHGFGAEGCMLEATPVCANNQCKNNGTCVVVGRGTRCMCSLGYIGPTCEERVACQPNPCRNGGICNLLPGNKFRCSCSRGSTGHRCEVTRNICGAIIQQESGEITYPSEGNGTYEANERCAWLIRTANTKILNVTFERFDVEEASDCSKDWLQIHDGRTLASQLIGRFCGKALPLSGNIVSSHQQLFFWFRSDNGTHGSGFKLRWTSQEHICGGNLELGPEESALINSPGYPGKAPSNRECQWTITAPYANRLVLRFYEVVLGGNSNCSQDTLKIFDSDAILRTICESAKPEPLHTSSNQAIVNLHTDSAGADSAFALHIEVVPGIPNCGGLFTEPNGIISAYINTEVCVYLIQQPLGTKIELQITKQELIDSHECRLQRIEIFDGSSEDDPLLKVLCGDRNTTLETFVSESNFMLVRYEYALVGIDLPKTFEATYKRICNERLFGPGIGIITTPNYPSAYYDGLKCTYDIYGPTNTVVSVNFTDFSITPSVATGAAFNDEQLNFVDVYLSRAKGNKRRFYKGEPMHLVSETNYMRVVFNAAVNSQRGRGLRLEYSFDDVGCGGVMVAPQGKFALDNSKFECEWIIEAENGQYISLQLGYIHWADQTDRGEFAIYANSSVDGTGQLMGRYSAGNVDIKETYHTSLLTIIWKRPKTTSGPRSFLSLVGIYTLVNGTEGCGGNFSARFGVIKSPSWPGPYDAQSRCTWIITAPLGNKIELRVQNFSLESYAGSCIADWLIIRNGKYLDSPLIGRYCGTSIPARIPSFSNRLLLEFHSDATVSGPGFYITWQQTESGCGGRLTSQVGSIHSPHYPNVNAGAVECEWQISIAQSSSIDISLTRIVTGMDMCNTDLFAMYDGPTTNSQLLKFNCSTDALNFASVKASSNQVLVRYTIGEQDDAVLFMLDYKSNCNQVIDSLEGVIESPNFPDPYPPAMECVWDIKGARNNKISLAFSHLLVEQRDLNCLYDFVELIDMRDDVVLSSQHLCERPIDAITTEGNRLKLRFVSDLSEQSGGFRAEFKQIGCGEHLTNDLGNFASPNAPYSLDLDCVWHIEVEMGKQIVLQFTELHMEAEVTDCARDMITVAEDKNFTTKLLKECQVEQMPIIITSPANRLYIRLLTSERHARKYFRATYTTKDAICGGLFHGNRGVITSPNYANGYATNVECVWNIRIEDSYNLEIFIDDLVIQPASADCNDAYVEVNTKNDKNRVQRFCGSNGPSQYLTYATYDADITFNVSAKAKAKFALRYDKSCSYTVTDTSGFLTAKASEACTWTIEAAKGSLIYIDILHLECECAAANSSCRNGVFLYQDDSLDFNATAANSYYCANHQTNIVLPFNMLMLRAVSVNFRARYSTIQSACGGTLTSLRGYLVSPNYPSTYPDNVECTWLIEATHGNYIELNFDMFDIAKSEQCNGDYVEVRTSEYGRILGIYCGPDGPGEPLMGFEKIWIKFRSTEGSTGKGFKFSWNYAHNNELEATGYSGKIEPPPITAARAQEEPYRWRIMVPRGQFIKMQFIEYSAGLLLYDGFDNLALEIALPTSPWHFVSSSNVLYLSTLNQDLCHFMLLWETVNSRNITGTEPANECHEIITLPFQAMRFIKSPGYPHGYANDLNCNWEVTALDPTQHVVFTLYNIDLEDFDECSLDYVRVSSSADLQTWHEQVKLCTNANNASLGTVVYGTPYLNVEFKTDASVNKTGFRAMLQTKCGANITNAYGIILDKHITSALTVDGLCVWHIAVRPGKRIAFNFQFKPAAERYLPCEQYAMIYDGIDMHAPILPPGQICNGIGQNISTFETTTNQAVLKYNLSRTWPVAETLLWNVTYREINDCNDEIRLTDSIDVVNVSSPRYPNIPQPHTECTWTIIGPLGETLQVDFIDRFDMNRRYCTREFVELFDGSTTMARSLGRFCNKPAKTLHSTGNVLLVHYLTDIAEPRTGFRARISKGACGGTFTSNTGYVSSKDYPAIGAYPRMATCEYTIKVYPNSFVRLNFTDLHMPYDAQHPETSDRIEIFASTNSSESITYFGNITELPFVESENNEVTVRFSTFRNGMKYRGFRLRFDRINGLCFRDVSGESGFLTLRKNSFRSPTPFGVVCRWLIRVPKGQRVRLEFVKLEFKTENFTTSFQVLTTKFEFYNDFGTLSKITEFDLANWNTSTVIESTDNLMAVRLRLVRIDDVTAKAHYTSSEEAPCPPNIGDSAAGGISINKLSEYNSYYCDIKFSVAEFETITFKIDELLIKGTERGRAFVIRFKDEDGFMPFQVLNENVTNHMVSFSPRRGVLNLLQTNNVGIISFTANYRRHACGGALQLDDAFEINYPNIPGAGPNYGVLECVWTLKSPKLVVTLIGNVSLSDNCEREYIAIYRASSPEYMELQRICHNTTSIAVDLVSAYTMVLYHTERIRPGQSSFRLVAQRIVGCGQKTTVHTTVPTRLVAINASQYKNNLECWWEYETSVGMYLSVHFEGRFFVENSANCSKDYVEVQGLHGGLWSPEARFCGRDAPNVFNTTSNTIRVLFRTDDAITGDGFSFKVAATCNRVFNVTREMQTIASPSIFDRRHIRCQYIFIAGVEDVITVNVRNKNPFSLIMRNIGRICSAASFTAYKESEPDKEVNSGRICIGNEVRARRYLRLEYVALIESAFTLEYSVSSCGGNVSAAPTLLGTPKDIDSVEYAPNMHCVWYISAPPDHAIVVRFKFLDMEYQKECQHDYVVIYEGSTFGNNQISKLCGKMTSDSHTVLVDGNHAVVAAISDASISRSGFIAEIIFTRNCNERISLNEGNAPIAVMREVVFKAPEEAVCSIRVSAPLNYRVRVQFKDLELNAATATCSKCEQCNHFEVFDSVGAESSLIGRYCNDTADSEVISSFEDVLLMLKASHPGHYKFEIMLEMEHSICGTHNEMVLHEDEYINIIFPPTIDTPQYPPNTHCHWRIQGNNSFQLVITSMDLQNVSQITGKCSDYIHVQMDYDTSRYFCGKGENIYLDMPSYSKNFADITFHSDSSNEGKGFHITAMPRSICNRTHNLLSGNLLYNMYNFPDKDCVDEIRVPENYTLTFHLLTVYFRPADNSSLSLLKMVDIISNKTIFERTTNEYESSQQLYSNTSAVRIHASHFLDISMSYYVHDKRLTPGCGGEITTLQGQLSSPPYGNDRNYSTCRWSISVAEPNRISLIFTAFDMGPTANCNLDYVDISEVQSNGAKYLSHRYCGPDTPPTYNSNSSHLEIVSYKSPNFDGIGWSIYFSPYQDEIPENRFAHQRS